MLEKIEERGKKMGQREGEEELESLLGSPP